MKQLTCEMCGSTDLMKQDGVFVCQSCGCKYSVEEAKRMMVEGTVDVQGTVKVDNSAFVEKYLANARRAKQKEDWEETEKYYNMVEQNDPDNIEAIFYSSYGKAKASLTDADVYKRGATFKVLKNCISIVDDHYKPERREENKQAIISMGIDLGKMVCSDFVFTEWKNGYGVVTKTNKDETISMFSGLLDAFKETMDNIQKVDDQPYLHEAAIAFYTKAMSTGYWRKDFLQNWITKEEHALERIARQQKATKEKERKEKIAKYWEAHAEEKANLDREQADLKKKMDDLTTQIAEKAAKIDELRKERDKKLPCEIEYDKQRDLIRYLEAKRDKCGIFKGSEKKAIQSRLDTEESPKLESLKKTVDAEKKAHQDKFNAEINVVKDEGKELHNEVAKLQKRSVEITTELNKDR